MRIERSQGTSGLVRAALKRLAKRSASSKALGGEGGMRERHASSSSASASTSSSLSAAAPGRRMVTTRSAALKAKSMLRVLAFEDSYDIEEMLRVSGVSTVESFKQCWDSSNCLDTVNEYRPDVLLLDYFMPPHTGLSVLKMLNEAVREGRVVRPRFVIGMSSELSCNEALLGEGADFAFNKFELANWSGWKDM